MNKQIKKGDYIGVISSSGLLKFSNKEQIDESIMNANECGLNVKLGNYLYKNEKSKEELLKDKLSDFNKMINDDDVKMIIFSRGGQDSDELLDYLNYNLIKKTNKNFVGLSDLTSILNAIYAKTGLITFHGCVFKKYVNNIPMIKCTDFGHCECNVSIGAEVELDADKQKVTILNNIFE